MEEIFKKLIELPTVTNNRSANKEALDYIAQFLKQRGMYTVRPSYEGIESLVATTRPTKAPKILLAAHVDVVHGTEEMFKLRKNNGRYIGRGTADMKFAIAAYMQLIDSIKNSLSDYDLGIMITTDEEIGGFNGVKKLVEDGYIPEVVILPDMGDTPSSWKLERAAKGRISLTVKSVGQSAHGGRPWLGENAIDKLMAALDEMKSHFPDQSPTTNTFVVTTIEGGEAFNQIPSHASATVDIRFLTNQEPTEIMQKINALAEKHGVKVINDEKSYCVACSTDLNNPFVSKFVNIVENLTSEKIDITDSTAGSDARFFAEAGVPYIVAGPPAGGCHSDEEWVSSEGLNQLLDVLRSYVDQTAK